MKGIGFTTEVTVKCCSVYQQKLWWSERPLSRNKASGARHLGALCGLSYLIPDCQLKVPCVMFLFFCALQACPLPRGIFSSSRHRLLLPHRVSSTR